MLANLPLGIQKLVGPVAGKLTKHSPTILLVGGLVGMAAAVVMACKGTTKVQEVMDNHKDQMAMTREGIEISKKDEETGKDPSYTEEDAKKDRVTITCQTAWKLTKLYGPAVLLFVMSSGMIIGGQKIMSSRNAALLAAYKLVEDAFNKYKERVKAEIGEEKERELRYKDVVKDEEDEEIPADREEREHPRFPGCSMYARLFEPLKRLPNGSWEGSDSFSTAAVINHATLTQKQNWVNERLKASGYLFLNDVYEELGFARTKAGQVVGWLRRDKSGKDGVISFGPWMEHLSNVKNGDPILLDFNVDGPILDRI